MKIELEFKDIKPIALNNYQKITTIGGKPRKYKTAQAKSFDSIINNQIRQFKSEINRLNKYYDETRHSLSIDYRFYFPCVTKKKTISKTAGDIDNQVKSLQDNIFNQLNADDSAVCSMSVRKNHSIELVIKVIIWVKPIENIM